MRPKTPTEVRQLLRSLARDFLKTRRHFTLEPVLAAGRPSDAYYRCRDPKGRTFEVAVRTAKRGRLAFQREEEGTWRTLENADLVLIASFGDEDQPKSAELYLVEAPIVRKSLEEAYLALSPAKRAAKGTFPVWVSVDEVQDGRKAPGSGIAKQAIDHVTVSLGEAVSREQTETEHKQTTVADLIADTQRKIAELTGFPIEMVHIDLRIGT